MARTFQVTFDAGDPTALGGFWAEALGYVEQPPPDGFDSWEEFAERMEIPPEERDKYYALIDPDGVGPRVFFQKVPEGKTAKNRVHLDVNVADRGFNPDERLEMIAAEVTRLKDLGATELRQYEERGAVWVVMKDPEGNEFCVQ